MEGLVATAEKYYDWTDARTEVPDDGKALFGRDAMANYMLIGAKDLGSTLFTVENGKMTVNLTEDVARKLWDNYYVPFVKGLSLIHIWMPRYSARVNAFVLLQVLL